MESKNLFRHFMAVLVTLIPLAYLAATWSSIPETIALHFGADGAPDKYGSKDSRMLWSVFIAGVSLLTYVIVVNAHKLDKKRLNGVKPPIFDTIALTVVVFMAVLNLAIIINSIYPDTKLYTKLIMPALGLLFIFLGNVLYNIKPNRFVGVRIPWTLKDNDNWKHTHRMSSKLFFVGGILITIVSLGSNVEVATKFMSGVTLIIVFTTILYSYLYAKRNQKNNA